MVKAIRVKVRLVGHCIRITWNVEIGQHQEKFCEWSGIFMLERHDIWSSHIGVPYLFKLVAVLKARKSFNRIDHEPVNASGLLTRAHIDGSLFLCFS